LQNGVLFFAIVFKNTFRDNTICYCLAKVSSFLTMCVLFLAILIGTFECVRSSGLRTKQHHEVNHFLYSVSSQVYNQVQKEVVVKERSTVLEADGSETIINGLPTNLTIPRGLREPQEVAFLDVRVVDSDAASYVSQPAMNALTSAEDEKVRKYHEACESKGGFFTPFVMSADGVLAPQATKFLETLAERLTEKQNSLCNASYGETINWLRLQFASVRAASLVLRAPKTNYPQERTREKREPKP
jgi:hypothetical protein